jgi:hypothetical protein
MKLLVVTLALAMTSTARADDEERPLTPLERAHSTKVTGMTLTGAGLVLMAAGGAMVVASTQFRSCPPFDDSSPCVSGRNADALSASSSTAMSLLMGGAIVSVFGDVLLLIGAPIWAVGAKREKRERAKLTFLPTGIAGRF